MQPIINQTRYVEEFAPIQLY